MTQTTANNTLTPKQPNKRTAKDDVDDTIYDLRIRQHQSLRTIAKQVGLSHTVVNDRLNKLLTRITHPEVQQMRTQEGHRIDELMTQQRLIMLAALGHHPDGTPREPTTEDDEGTPVPVQVDLDLAHKCLREIHALTRTRAQLFGLNQEARENDPTTADLNDLFKAYTQGRRDQQAETKETTDA